MDKFDVDVKVTIFIDHRKHIVKMVGKCFHISVEIGEVNYELQLEFDSFDTQYTNIARLIPLIKTEVTEYILKINENLKPIFVFEEINAGIAA